MRLPLAAWRAGTRWPLVLVAGVALLVIAVAVCEAIGWPQLQQCTVPIRAQSRRR